MGRSKISRTDSREAAVRRFPKKTGVIAALPTTASPLLLGLSVLSSVVVAAGSASAAGASAGGADSSWGGAVAASSAGGGFASSLFSMVDVVRQANPPIPKISKVCTFSTVHPSTKRGILRLRLARANPRLVRLSPVLPINGCRTDKFGGNLPLGGSHRATLDPRLLPLPFAYLPLVWSRNE